MLEQVDPFPRRASWILIGAVFLTFLPSLFNGFVRDDALLLLHNPLVESLSLRSIRQIFTDFQHDFYMPFTFLSFTVERHIFGLNPLVYHTTNLALHAANAVLVFFILKHVCGRSPEAFLAAVIFALHPMRVESVAWVSERKDVLYAFFYLGSVWGYLKASEDKKHYRVVSVLFFIFSLLSKPMMAFTLPLTLVVLDLSLGAKVGQALKNKSIFIVLAGIALLVSLGYYQRTSKFSQAANLNGLADSTANLAHIADAAVFYIQKFLYPVRLSTAYPFPGEPGQLFRWHSWVSPMLVFSWVLTALTGSKKFTFFFFGTTFFLVVMIPPFYISTKGVLNDRFTYVASIGLSFLAAKTLFWIKDTRRIGENFWLAGVGFLIACLAIGTWNRCAVWKDDVSYWNDAVQYEPLYPQPYNGRAMAYLKSGNSNKAMEDLNEAIHLNPGFTLAYFSRGELYFNRSNYPEAISDLKTAVRLAPYFTPAKDLLIQAQLAEQGAKGVS